MSAYTPGLDALRESYIRTGLAPTDVVLAEFDRAIAKVRADAKREAWDEGVRAAVASECYNPACGSCVGCDTILVNPYEVSE